MTVFELTEKELDELGATGALRATALKMAEQLDSSSSATSKAMCGKLLVDVMKQIRADAPPKKMEDRVDEIAKRRERRIAQAAG
jgi:hypothetical protein